MLLFGGRRKHNRYDLRADASRNFRHLLEAIGVAKVDSGAFEQALTFSSFEKMGQLEASRSFATKILQPRNPDDPESFKVRKGMIVGFREYLSAESQSYARQVCAGLNPAVRLPGSINKLPKAILARQTFDCLKQSISCLSNRLKALAGVTAH